MQFSIVNFKKKEPISLRLDAEFYRPIFLETDKQLKRGKWDYLENLSKSIKSFGAYSLCNQVEYKDKGIPFIRVSNLNQLELSEDKYISEELYVKIKQHQPTKGEILLSKDGSPGMAYLLHEQPKKMIPSGGILRLQNKSRKINSEYLTLVLNSILIQEQVNRDVGGSIIMHWRPDQVKETVIPILSSSFQSKIKQQVTESFALRKQSKQLLESAKLAVEMAIEQNEAVAIDWLEQQ